MAYANLFVTTPSIPRTCIKDLPHWYEVTCSGATGWELWERHHVLPSRLVASEFDNDRPLRLDVGGHVICDGGATKEGPSEGGP